MAGNYLKANRHGTTFYFRRRIPDDLRPAFGKPFLVKTLGTGKRREAIILARALAARTDSLFHHIRTMPDHRDKLRLDLTFKLDFNDFGGLKSVHIEADTPEEHEQAKAMLNDALDKLPACMPMGIGGIAQKPTGIPFCQATDVFLAGQRKDTTRRTYKGRLKHAQAFFGADRDIRHIEQADLSEYAEHANKDIPNSATASVHITTLSGMLNHFRITKGWGPELTTKRLIEKKDTPDSDDRDAYSLEQLRKLFFNAAKYRTDEPHKYWATVAVPFLGCRIEELAQINLHTDLAQDQGSGVWYIDMNAKPDSDGIVRKSMKNKASWRCVPIHSALVQGGFVDYLIRQREKGLSRPFEYGWKPAEFDDGKALKWSHYITNWGGRELKKLAAEGAISDPARKLSYFHSMRHTFSGCMGRAGVAAEVSEATLGHAYAGSERERYHKLKSDPVQLALCGIEVGLNELAALLDSL